MLQPPPLIANAAPNFRANSFDGVQIVLGQGGSNGGPRDFEGNSIEEYPDTTDADSNVPIVIL